MDGLVEFPSGMTFGSTADYSCLAGYELSGTSSVMCEASGMWSDSPPVCNSKSNNYSVAHNYISQFNWSKKK